MEGAFYFLCSSSGVWLDAVVMYCMFLFCDRKNECGPGDTASRRRLSVRRWWGQD